MEQYGHIGVTFKGQREGHSLGPMDVDVSEIREVLSDIESFLYPSRSEKMNRPRIAYQLEEGSARHKFFLPITAALSFAAITGEVQARGSIDFLDFKRASILDKFQRKATANGWTIAFETSTSPETPVLHIAPDTAFYNAAPAYVNTDFVLYGTVYAEGGIEPNLHIETAEWGRLTVAATKEQLSEGDNKLYRMHGIRASGKQHLPDGLPYDLKLEGFIEYDPRFDRAQLTTLIARAKPALSAIGDVDQWLENLRGGGAGDDD